MTPLEDFRLRLAGLRDTCNRSRARGVAMIRLAAAGPTPIAGFAARVDEETDRIVASGVGYMRLDERWDAAIVGAGAEYLRRGWHLRPVRVRTCTGRWVHAVDQDVRPGLVHREGSSRLGEHAAAAVGLFGETLAGLVLGWMRAHGAIDPLRPWRLAAVEVADGSVPTTEHARWRVRPRGARGWWGGMPVEEAQRLLDRNPDYSAELDEAATAAARAASATALDAATATR